MVAYLVNQIVLGRLTYQEVVKARPDLQILIDSNIKEKGLTGDRQFNSELVTITN